MNILNCPNCGGRMRSETIGWKCEICKGFVDMRGRFHEHKEEPFMPPLTNADRIRRMSDEELAKFLEYEGGGACAEVCGWLDWLQQPAEEDT